MAQGARTSGRPAALLGPDLRRAYAARFPDDPALIDLDRWHVFETENPKIFVAMYRFWVQKLSQRRGSGEHGPRT